MNFNTQVCTTREQSEQLLALGLNKETADCLIWQCDGKDYTSLYFSDSAMDEKKGDIPAWSLHRLVSIMPSTIFIDDDGEEWGAHLYINEYMAQYDAFPIDVMIFKKRKNLFDNLIDCIEWLINNNHFNKQYLNQKL